MFCITDNRLEPTVPILKTLSIIQNQSFVSKFWILKNTSVSFCHWICGRGFESLFFYHFSLHISCMFSKRSINDVTNFILCAVTAVCQERNINVIQKIFTSHALATNNSVVNNSSSSQSDWHQFLKLKLDLSLKLSIWFRFWCC